MKNKIMIVVSAVILIALLWCCEAAEKIEEKKSAEVQL